MGDRLELVSASRDGSLFLSEAGAKRAASAAVERGLTEVTFIHRVVRNVRSDNPQRGWQVVCHQRAETGGYGAGVGYLATA